MRICVFGASSPTIDEKYIRETEKMGEALAERGHGLVFGAGKKGLMGAAARGFRSRGAEIIGVIPEFFKEEKIEAIYDECDELILTESMRSRKKIMEDKSDAFIITPGGIGTYEEFFEILTLKQLCRHKKPIAVYNLFGFYDDVHAAMLGAMKKEFIKESCSELYFISDNLDDIIEYIEAPVENDYTHKHFKNG